MGQVELGHIFNLCFNEIEYFVQLLDFPVNIVEVLFLSDHVGQKAQLVSVMHLEQVLDCPISWC